MNPDSEKNEKFEAKVLQELQAIRADIDAVKREQATTNKDLQRQGQRLDSLVGTLVTALTATVISAGLLVLARNALDFWVLYSPPTNGGR